MSKVNRSMSKAKSTQKTEDVISNHTPEFTVDWFSPNIPILKELFAEVGKHPMIMLEIGCFQGKSTLWFLENVLTHPDSKIVCIEPFTGSLEHTPDHTKNMYALYEKNVLLSPYSQKVVLLKHKSGDALLMPSLREVLFDVIYIDGDHRAAAVMQDAVLSFGVLKVNGLMIFDDFFGGGQDMFSVMQPYPGITRFVEAYEPFVRVISAGYQLVIQKIRDI